MTTVSKYFLIVLLLSAVVLAQNASKKSQATPHSAASTPATSGNGKGQKDAAAKGSGHTSSMSGNHKDVMTSVSADKNQGSGSHSGNMIGNHKDMMMSVAPAPSTGNKTQPATGATTANPTPAPSKPAQSDPVSHH